MLKTQLAFLAAAGFLMSTGAADAAGTGSIKGSVKLAGKAPERKELNLKSDPFCAKKGPVKDEEVIVGSKGELKNVVVRIAKGAPATKTPPTTEAVLDQDGCMYRPRVLVVQAGQPVAIKNSDQTLHNVHTYKGPATLFNVAQIQGMAPIKRTFKTGDVVKFKCDVHPWMTGYVLVTDNPHFTVTGDNGEFEIKDLAPGKYTVEAWHEKLGAKTSELTVAADKPAELKLEFAAK